MLKFMSNLIKSTLIAGIVLATPAALTVATGVPTSSSTAVYAAPTPTPAAVKDCSQVDTNAALSPSDPCFSKGDAVSGKIRSFTQVLAGIVVAMAALMIVYAGFKYATSQGDPKTTEQAKMQIIGAGIGIVLAMIAYLIVNIFTSL